MLALFEFAFNLCVCLVSCHAVYENIQLLALPTLKHLPCTHVVLCMCGCSACMIFALKRWMFSMLKAVLRTGYTPARNQFSFSFMINKKVMSHWSDKTIGKDSRQICCFDALPKLILSACSQMVPISTVGDYCYGAVPKRCREAAIATQAIMASRLQAAGKAQAMKSYDCTTVFNSPPHEQLRDIFADCPEHVVLKIHASQHCS